MSQPTELPTIVLAEGVVPLGDLEDLCRSFRNAVSSHDVRVVYRQRPPLGLADFPQGVALILLFNPASISFLSALGKDAYKGVRSALFRLYRRVINEHVQPTYSPFAVEVDNVIFTFGAGLEEEEFEHAIEALSERFSDHPYRGGVYTFYKWDVEKHEWLPAGVGYFR